MCHVPGCRPVQRHVCAELGGLAVVVLPTLYCGVVACVDVSPGRQYVLWFDRWDPWGQ